MKQTRWSPIHSFFIALAGFAIVGSQARAAAGPQSITLDGRLFDSSALNTPLQAAGVSLLIQILDDSGTCVLYSERQTVDTTNSSGYFNLQVGSVPGDAKREPGDPGNAMATIFQNTTPIAAQTGCAAYTPLTGHRRYMRVYMSVGSATEVLAPDLLLDSVPTALVAETVQGLDRAHILEIGAGDLTQANVEGVFSGTNYTNLISLLSGTSTQYLRQTSNGVLLPAPATPPATPTAGQMWFDSTSGKMKYATTGGAVVEFGTGGTGSIMTSDLADGSVTTIKIANGAVTDVKLATNAVTTAKVLDGAITEDKLAANAVTASKIAAEAIDGSKLDPAIAITTTGNILANVVTSGTTDTRLIRLVEPTPGTRSVSLRSPALTNSYVLTFPPDAGAQGQVLTLDASGNFEWTTPASGVGTVASGTAGQLAYYNANGSTVSGLNSAASSVLVTNASGIPAWSPLSNDSFSQYALLAGRAGGQTLRGGTGASESLTLDSTANGTKGVIALNPSGGNVGIGTLTPTAALDVNGAITSTGSSNYPRFSSQGLNLSSYNADQAAISAGGRWYGGAWRATSATTHSAVDLGAGTISFNANTGLTAGATFTPSTRMFLDANGNFGVGTTTPSARLDVVGTGDASAIIVPRDGTRPTTGVNGMIRYNTSTNVLETFAAGSWQSLAGTGTGAYLPLAGGTMSGAIDMGGNTLRGGSAASASLTFDSTSDATKGNILLNTAGGNVGIGTTTPGSTLDVNGTIRFADGTAGAPSLAFRSAPTTGIYGGATSLALSVGGTARVNVTSSQTYVDNQLMNRNFIPTLYSPSVAPTAVAIFANTSATNGAASITSYQTTNNDSTPTVQRAYAGAVNESTGYSPSYIVGRQVGASGYAESMRIDPNGNLGVGTTTPAARLDVVGTGDASAIIVPRDGTRPTTGVNGMIRYNTGTNVLETFANGSWQSLAGAGTGSYLPLAGGTMAGAIDMGGQSINGGSAASASLTLDSTSNATKGNILLNTAGGNVGIGTTNPQGALDVRGPSSSYMRTASGGIAYPLTLANSNGSSATDRGVGLNFRGPTSVDLATVASAHESGNSAYVTISSLSSGTITEKLRISSNGRVGIGTNLPSAGLDVVGTGDASAIIVPRDGTRPTTGVNGMIRYNTGTNVLETFANGSWQSLAGAGTGAYLPLAGGTMSGAIDMGGNTLRGGSAASASLTLDSTSNATKGNILLNTAGGNVGIGTTTPAAPLDVVGTTTYMQFLRSNTTDAVGLGFNNTGSNRTWGLGVGGTGVGTVGLQNGKFGIWDTTAGANRFTIDTSGNVGVGTTSPSTTMQVMRNQDAWTSIDVRNANANVAAGSTLSVTSDTITTRLTSYSSLASNVAQLYTNGPALLLDAGSASGYIQFRTGVTPAPKMTLANNGYVGIGTTAPASSLDVFGTGDASAIIVPRDGTRPTTPVNGMIRYNTGSNALETYANGAWQNLAGSGTGAYLPLAGGTMSGAIDMGGNTLRGGSGANASLTLDSTSNATKGNIALNPTGGNVGIGTSTPGARLSVEDTATAASTTGGEVLRLKANVAGGTIGSGPKINFFDNANSPMASVRGYGFGTGLSGLAFDTGYTAPATRMVINNAGNVGIGTTTPNKKLSVAGSMEIGSSNSDYQHLRIGGGNSSGYLYGAFATLGDGIHLGYNYYNDNAAGVIPNSAGSTSRLTASYGYISLATGSANTAPSERMRINETGYVGIGTTTPASSLDVVGTGDASAIIVPRDSTRPTTPVNGMIRYNTGTNALEAFANGSWQSLAGGGTGAYLPLAGGTMSGAIDMGGQTLRGGSSASASLTLDSTSNATKGNILLNPTGGYVGIGTTNPAAPLHVIGSIRVSQAVTSSAEPTNDLLLLNNQMDSYGVRLSARDSLNFIVDNDNNGTGAFNFRKGTTNPSTATPLMTITNAGSVGIGTTAPGAALEVVGDIRSMGGNTVKVKTAAGADRAVMTANSGTFGGFAAFNASDVKNVEIQATGNSFLNGGNLGIGTTAPVVPLDVRSGVTGSPAISGTTQTNGGLRIESSASNIALDMGNDGGNSANWIQSVNKTDLSIVTARLLLNPNGGNVGIGTTTPAARLDVVGTGDASAIIVPRDGTRPTTGVNGMIRYNTGTNTLEAFANGAWSSLAGASAGGSFLPLAGGTMTGAINMGGQEIDGGSAASASLTLDSTSNVTKGNILLNPSGGNVGIGTTGAPSTLSFGGNVAREIAMTRSSSATANPLTITAGGTVAGATNGNGGALILSSGMATGAGGSSMEFRTASPGASGTADVVPSTKMAILSNGNIGIGTTAASARLDVAGAGDASAIIVPRDGTRPTTGVNGMIRYNTGTNNLEAFANGSWQNLAGASAGGSFLPLAGGTMTGAIDMGGQTLRGGSAASASLTLDSTSNGTKGNILLNTGGGNVGIGTTSAPNRLTIANPIAGGGTTGTLNLMGAYNSGTSVQTLDFSINSATNLAARIGVPTSGATGEFAFYTTTDFSTVAPTEKMRINSLGAVGIGTTSPASQLEVSGTGYQLARFKNRATTGDRSALFEIENGNATPSRWSFTVGGTGNGAGITNGQFYFERYGLGAVMTIDTSGNVGIGTTTPGYKLDVNGTVRATAFNSPSDKRLKYDVKTMDGLATVRKLRGVQFKWNSSGETDAGVIAQELEEVLPFLVSTDKQSGFKSVRYSSLISPLIEATKELDLRCEAVEGRMNEAERRLASVEAEVARMKVENEGLRDENQKLKERLERIEKALNIK